MSRVFTDGKLRDEFNEKGDCICGEYCGKDCV